jgi:hemoglobin
MKNPCFLAMMRSIRHIATGLAWMTGVAATTPAWADDTLYSALGGEDNVQRIVNDLVDNVYADPRIKAYFVTAVPRRLRVKLAEQICVVSGGPCEYTGNSMHSAHKMLGIDRPAFNAMVEDLQDAMDRNHVPFHVQNRLLAVLAPMYRDIETR